MPSGLNQLSYLGWIFYFMISIVVSDYNIDFSRISSDLSIANARFITTKLRRAKYCRVLGTIKDNRKDQTFHGVQHYLLDYLMSNNENISKLKEEFADIIVEILINYTNYYKDDRSQYQTIFDPRLIKLMSQHDILFRFESTCKIISNEDYLFVLPGTLNKKFKYNSFDKDVNSHLYLNIIKYEKKYLLSVCRKWLEISEKLDGANKFILLDGKKTCLIFDIGEHAVFLVNKETLENRFHANSSIYCAYLTMVRYLQNEQVLYEKIISKISNSRYCFEQIYGNVVDLTKKSKMTESVRNYDLSCFLSEEI